MAAEKLYVTNPEKWLRETAAGADLLCIVIFRGSWDKYDKHYLRKLGHHHITTMKNENVKLLAWTSEGEEGAKRADKEWGLTKEFGYDMVIGDETNALANWLKEDEVLPDLVTATPEQAHVKDQVKEGSYPNGMVQPGMVWYAHHGNMVFHWVKPFNAETGWGGPGRPEPLDLWQQVLKRKHALDHGSAVMPSHGTMQMCSNDLEVNMSNCGIL